MCCFSKTSYFSSFCCAQGLEYEKSEDQTQNPCLLTPLFWALDEFGKVKKSFKMDLFHHPVAGL